MAFLGSLKIASAAYRRLLLPGELCVGHGKAGKIISQRVFIDTGCTAKALIDADLVNEFSIPTVSLPRMIPVNLADNKPASFGPIRLKTLPLKFKLGDHVKEIEFLVTRPPVPITLGLPWLQQSNPNIDWEKMEISFDESGLRSLPLLQPNLAEPIESPKAHVIQRPIESPKMSDNSGNGVEQPTKHDAKGDFPAQEIYFVDIDELDTYMADEPADIQSFILEPTDLNQISSGTKRFKDVYSELFINSVLTTHHYAESTLKLNDQGIPLIFSDLEQAFKKPDQDLPLPPHREYDLKINLREGAKIPPPARIYPLPPDELELLDKVIIDEVRRGELRPSKSPTAAAVFFVKKPNGEKRLCYDYRPINAETIGDAFPMPRVQDILDSLEGKKYFTQLDLVSAYHLVRIAEGHEWKLAIRCTYGLFEPTVMPFGPKNCPAVFQRFMESICSDFIKEGWLKIYLDNLLLSEKSDSDILNHNTRRLLNRLIEHHLYVKPSKCSFVVQRIDALGFIVSQNGLEMDEQKVAAIRDWPIPTTKKQLHSFVQFCNFYRRFIKNFSERTKLLHNCYQKSTDFDTAFNDECKQLFEELKLAFTTAPVLKFFDYTKQAFIEADSSKLALGTVLSQYHDNILHPVAFHSRALNQIGEINYPIHDKELLGIFESFRIWRTYLLPAPDHLPTIVLNDHSNLKHFMTNQKLNRRQMTWAYYLSEFNFLILHRAGKASGKPDALSRRWDYQEMEAELESGNYLKLFETFRQGEVTLDFDLFSTEPATFSTLNQSNEFLSELKASTTESELLKEFKAGKYPDWTYSDSLLTTSEGLLIIPDGPLRKEIMQNRHASRLGAHFGLAKGLELITRDFYWPGIRNTLRRFIRACDVCARAKADRH